MKGHETFDLVDDVHEAKYNLGGQNYNFSLGSNIFYTSQVCFLSLKFTLNLLLLELISHNLMLFCFCGWPL